VYFKTVDTSTQLVVSYDKLKEMKYRQRTMQYFITNAGTTTDSMSLNAVVTQVKCLWSVVGTDSSGTGN